MSNDNKLQNEIIQKPDNTYTKSVVENSTNDLSKNNVDCILKKKILPEVTKESASSHKPIKLESSILLTSSTDSLLFKEEFPVSNFKFPESQSELVEDFCAFDFDGLMKIRTKKIRKHVCRSCTEKLQKSVTLENQNDDKTPSNSLSSFNVTQSVQKEIPVNVTPGINVSTCTESNFNSPASDAELKNNLNVSDTPSKKSVSLQTDSEIQITCRPISNQTFNNGKIITLHLMVDDNLNQDNNLTTLKNLKKSEKVDKNLQTESPKFLNNNFIHGDYKFPTFTDVTKENLKSVFEINKSVRRRYNGRFQLCKNVLPIIEIKNYQNICEISDIDITPRRAQIPRRRINGIRTQSVTEKPRPSIPRRKKTSDIFETSATSREENSSCIKLDDIINNKYSEETLPRNSSSSSDASIFITEAVDIVNKIQKENSNLSDKGSQVLLQLFTQLLYKKADKKSDNSTCSPIVRIYNNKRIHDMESDDNFTKDDSKMKNIFKNECLLSVPDNKNNNDFFRVFDNLTGMTVTKEVICKKLIEDNKAIGDAIAAQENMLQINSQSEFQMKTVTNKISKIPLKHNSKSSIDNKIPIKKLYHINCLNGESISDSVFKIPTKSLSNDSSKIPQIQKLLTPIGNTNINSEKNASFLTFNKSKKLKQKRSRTFTSTMLLTKKHTEGNTFKRRKDYYASLLRKREKRKKQENNNICTKIPDLQKDKLDVNLASVHLDNPSIINKNKNNYFLDTESKSNNVEKKLFNHINKLMNDLFNEKNREKQTFDESNCKNDTINNYDNVNHDKEDTYDTIPTKERSFITSSNINDPNGKFENFSNPNLIFNTLRTINKKVKSKCKHKEYKNSSVQCNDLIFQKIENDGLSLVQIVPCILKAIISHCKGTCTCNLNNFMIRYDNDFKNKHFHKIRNKETTKVMNTITNIKCANKFFFANNSIYKSLPSLRKKDNNYAFKNLNKMTYSKSRIIRFHREKCREYCTEIIKLNRMKKLNTSKHFHFNEIPLSTILKTTRSNERKSHNNLHDDGPDLHFKENLINNSYNKGSKESDNKMSEILQKTNSTGNILNYLRNEISHTEECEILSDNKICSKSCNNLVDFKEECFALKQWPITNFLVTSYLGKLSKNSNVENKNSSVFLNNIETQKDTTETLNMKRNNSSKTSVVSESESKSSILTCIENKKYSLESQNTVIKKSSSKLHQLQNIFKHILGKNKNYTKSEK